MDWKRIEYEYKLLTWLRSFVITQLYNIKFSLNAFLLFITYIIYYIISIFYKNVLRYNFYVIKTL